MFKTRILDETIIYFDLLNNHMQRNIYTSIQSENHIKCPTIQNDDIWNLPIY